MQKTIFNIFIAVLVGIVFYFLSVNFILKIPSPMGGYEAVTYQAGCRVAVVAGLITVILLFVFNRKKEVKYINRNEVFYYGISKLP